MFEAIRHSSSYSIQTLSDALLKAGEIDAKARAEIDKKGPIAADKLEKARRERNSSGRPAKIDITPAEVIASLRLTAADGRPLDEDRLMHTVAAMAGLKSLKIDPLKLDHDLITDTLTRAFARRQVCVPISKNAGQVVFAIDNPFDQDLIHQLTALAGGNVGFVVSAKSDILRIITEIYGFQQSVRAAELDISSGVDLGNLEQLVRLKRIDDIEANDQHIVNAVEYLLHYAYEQRASDLHMEPRRNEAVV
ncbi:MAG: type II/IV secretion system protein, partial [Myxococcales bacterium]|nr:type II/IV secretion system protein [Myxococcales bacterium]